MADNKDSKKGASSFTVDHDASGVLDMPSITKLLNRKSLGFTKSSKPEPKESIPDFPAPEPASAPPPLNLARPAQVPEPAQPGPARPNSPGITLESSTPSPSPASNSPGEIALSFEEPGASFQLESSGGALSSPVQEPQLPATSSVRVQSAKTRTERPATAKLALWDAAQLKNGPDPLGRGVAAMMEKGARSVLFLAIVAPPPGSPVPHFVASAAIASTNRISLWTGMRWDPTVVPELWNLFVRTGYVELSPPGTLTNVKSNRNVVRSAFGAGVNEWLLLVRAGPASGCRGVLAMTADKGLLTELAAALPLLSAPVPASIKKAS